jgi:hypothetical protein
MPPVRLETIVSSSNRAVTSPPIHLHMGPQNKGLGGSDRDIPVEI